jgi:hypothetical protein
LVFSGIPQYYLGVDRESTKFLGVLFLVDLERATSKLLIASAYLLAS